MAALDYVECVRAESARFRDAITAETVELPVTACPGWSVGDLAVHLGEVQRWATLAVVTAARPDDTAIESAPPTADVDSLVRWLATGTEQLCAALAVADPDAPTWHPFPVPKVAAVWPRRQAHEVAIHRWDAQHASSTAEPIDAAFAADFVREYFEVVVPRVIDRDAREAPEGRLLVRLTDSKESLLVTSSATAVTVGGSDGPGDGTIEGGSSDVLLALWQRPSTGVSVANPVASRWLEFGGN